MTSLTTGESDLLIANLVGGCKLLVINIWKDYSRKKEQRNSISVNFSTVPQLSPISHILPLPVPILYAKTFPKNGSIRLSTEGLLTLQ
jgi:hypothetical protein